MGIPAAAKRKADEANKVFEEVYGKKKAPVTEVVNDPEPEVSEDTNPDETDSKEPPKPVSSAETTEKAVSQPPEERDQPVSGQETDKESWEQRYKTLQGMWKKDMPQLKSDNVSLRSEVASLRKQLGELKMASENKPEAVQVPDEVKKYLKPGDYEDYGEEMIDVVRRTAREEMSSVVSRLEAENAKLRQTVQGVESSVVQSGRQQMLSVMDRELPAWREINQSDDFKEWLQQTDPYSGSQKHELLLKAFGEGDVSRTLAFFNGYQNEYEAVNTEVQTTAPRKPIVDADKLVAPGTPKTVGAPRTQDGTAKVWTQQEISRFYADVARGKYRSEKRSAEKRKIEETIVKAAREGRVR